MGTEGKNKRKSKNQVGRVGRAIINAVGLVLMKYTCKPGFQWLTKGSFLMAKLVFYRPNLDVEYRKYDTTSTHASG